MIQKLMRSKMMTNTTFPAFGNILNTAIQVVKTSSNRKNGITEKKYIEEMTTALKLTEKQVNLTYKATLNGVTKDDFNCLFRFLDICNLCMTAMGLVKDNVFPLLINPISDNFLDFVAFNQTVTSDNLIKLDPFGKIFFWLANDNFNIVIKTMVSDDKEYIANLNRFEKVSFQELKILQKVCYGENGDPLLNFLIKETMRRTSVFMNNYANATLLNDYEKATHATILKKLMKLTPTQFEHLCLEVVQQSLKNEAPDSQVVSNHVGKTNDGGIDGIIKQTFPNGELHTYCIQAKLYQNQNKISNRELRNFVGAFPPDPKFHHGIFITTSDYTAPAIEYKDNLPSHSLILINQLALLELMIEHEVGVETVKTEALVLNKEFYRKLPK